MSTAPGFRTAAAPLLAGVLLLASPDRAAGEDLTIPPLQAPVTDAAGILGTKTEQLLNTELLRLHRSGGSQIVVLTLPSLGGQPIEAVSIRVADKWQPGSEKEDNGVIFLIAPLERRMRIEVGQGLEGSLTDAYASRIIRDTVGPLFKAGRMDDGVVAGVLGIIARTDPQFKPGVGEPRPVRQRKTGGGPLRFAGILLLVLLIFILRSFSGFSGGGGFRSGGFRSGGFGGGGFGGGGFGGGGFSGGGGGFSGGGASGGW